MAKKLEFFFDIGSPYSYIAATQIGKLASYVEIEWRPFLLGGVFKGSGNAAPIQVPARGAYMLKDLERLADFYRIKLHMPSSFPVNSLTAMRCLYALDAGLREGASMELFEAFWAEGRDISDPKVLQELFGSEILEKAGTEPIKLALKDASDEAVMRGAFGAPTFFLDDEMYFGQDRMFLIEHELKV